jgi:hypothetical protein
MKTISESIKEALSRKTGLIKCPLTGEELTDVTMLEAMFLQILSKAKKGKSDAINSLKRHGFNENLIDIVKNLEDLRFVLA